MPMSPHPKSSRPDAEPDRHPGPPARRVPARRPADARRPQGRPAKLKNAVRARLPEFEETLNADFEGRSAKETAILEGVALVQGINYLRRNLKGWMRPQKRHVDMHFRPGTRARRLPAARRRRHHVAVELPRRAVADAARHGDRGGQSRDDQAVRVHARNKRSPGQDAGRDLPRGAGGRRDRRARTSAPRSRRCLSTTSSSPAARRSARP